MSKTDKFVEILKDNGINPQVIYDVGAFDCAQSVELHHAFPQAKIYAFEPAPWNIAPCLQTINGFPITMLPFALGRVSRVADFYETNNEEAGSLYRANGTFLQDKGPVKVPVFAGMELDIPAPEALWMDAQGSEYGASNSRPVLSLAALDSKAFRSTFPVARQCAAGSPAEPLSRPKASAIAC